MVAVWKQSKRNHGLSLHDTIQLTLPVDGALLYSPLISERVSSGKT